MNLKVNTLICSYRPTESLRLNVDSILGIRLLYRYHV